MPNLTEKTRKFTVSSVEEDVRLDAFLKNHLPDFSRNQIQKWIKKGLVTCNAQVAKGSLNTKNGMEIELEVPDEEVRLLAESIPLDILYEDAHIIVINKPAGMVTHPSPQHHRGTMANALWHHLSRPGDLDVKNRRPGIVHRLDRDTSGVLVAAKSLKIQEALAAQFRGRQVKKTYRAIVNGVIRYKEGEIEGAIGKERDSSRMAVIPTGKESSTFFKVLKRFAGHSYVEVYPKTGRTHQIRVHLAKIDHPILGDALYGKPDVMGGIKCARCARQMLHAYKIEFIHPATKKSVKFEAPIPADMNSVLVELARYSRKR